MNKLNILTIALLIPAIVIGAINLSMHGSLQTLSNQLASSAVTPTAYGMQNFAAAPNVTKHAGGIFTSLSGNSLQMKIAGGDMTFALGSSMKYYRRVIMSDTAYQAALANLKSTDAPPGKDVYNQMQSIEGLNLNSGDNLVIAFNTNAAGSQVIIEIVKVINVK